MVQIPDSQLFSVDVFSTFNENTYKILSILVNTPRLFTDCFYYLLNLQQENSMAKKKAEEPVFVAAKKIATVDVAKKSKKSKSDSSNSDSESSDTSESSSSLVSISECLS